MSPRLKEAHVQRGSCMDGRGAFCFLGRFFFLVLWTRAFLVGGKRRHPQLSQIGRIPSITNLTWTWGCLWTLIRWQLGVARGWFSFGWLRPYEGGSWDLGEAKGLHPGRCWAVQVDFVELICVGCCWQRSKPAHHTRNHHA